MNKFLLFQQNGAVLLLMLILLLLAVTTVVLSALNDRHDYQLIQQQQTQRALHQAKQALIGYAASYDKTHTNDADAFVGYLPCPDTTGNGSATTCAAAGQTVLGRFPWRTLGLPPLRDGSGECLWYAVSGSFKNNPKTAQSITHDTDGDIIIKDVNGNILHGDRALNRAIAVVFAPNKPLSNQTRGDNGSGNQTECSHENAPTAGSNQASNYLESIGGVDNATGDGNLSIHDTSNRIFHDADSTDQNYPTFVQAATAYNSDGKEIFNDNLAIISAADFAPIYKLMDYRVVSKAITCIEQYRNDNRFNFLVDYSIPIGDWELPHVDTYRADVDVEIDAYVSEKIINCKFNDCNKSCDDICEAQKTQCITQCNNSFPNDVGDALDCANVCIANESSCNDCDQAKTTCEANCESAPKQENFYKTALDLSVNYPWASGLDDADFKEQNGARFGRIPSILIDEPITTTPLSVSHLQNNDMSDSWPTDCFNEHSWSWWQQWKDRIFYAFDDEYVTQSITHIWVKTERSANSIGSGANKVWILEDRDAFIARKAARETVTIAKLTDKNAYDGWEKTTASTPTSTTSLELSNIERSFIVISAGRRLALNQDSSDINYEPFTQIRDIDSFCDSYSALCSTCNVSPDSAYISGCYKTRIDNYLEGEAHNSLNLRKVSTGAMIGGNIPIDYTTQPVATIPTGNEAFIQETIDVNFFTDYACHSTSDCDLEYKK